MKTSLSSFFLLSTLAPAQVRTWTNAEGKKIEAALVSVTPAKEAVLKMGVAIHKVPLAKLSAEDQKWIATGAALTRTAITSAEFELCHRCGGTPAPLVVAGKVERIERKNDGTAYLFLEGGIVVEMTGKWFLLKEGVLYDRTGTHDDNEAKRRPNADAPKKLVFRTGDPLSLHAVYAADMRLHFKSVTLGAGTYWQVCNTGLPGAVQLEIKPNSVPVPKL